MCAVCGYPGKNRCAKCRNTFYCSKDCQLAHWKNGHKKRCNPQKPDTVQSHFLFDEYDLVSEEFDDQDIQTAKEFEEDDGTEIIDFDAAQAEAGNFYKWFNVSGRILLSMSFVWDDKIVLKTESSRHLKTRTSRS